MKRRLGLHDSVLARPAPTLFTCAPAGDGTITDRRIATSRDRFTAVSWAGHEDEGAVRPGPPSVTKKCATASGMCSTTTPSSGALTSNPAPSPVRRQSRKTVNDVPGQSVTSLPDCSVIRRGATASSARSAPPLSTGAHATGPSPAGGRARSPHSCRSPARAGAPYRT